MKTTQSQQVRWSRSLQVATLAAVSLAALSCTTPRRNPPGPQHRPGDDNRDGDNSPVYVRANESDGNAGGTGRDDREHGDRGTREPTTTVPEPDSRPPRGGPWG